MSKTTFLTPCQILLTGPFGRENLRPREFDDDDVLRIAFDQFWRKGVRGTSLSDIARDAGVQRGSLYNAFGSKEALFLCAYQRYADEYLSALKRCSVRGLCERASRRFSS